MATSVVREFGTMHLVAGHETYKTTNLWYSGAFIKKDCRASSESGRDHVSNDFPRGGHRHL